MANSYFKRSACVLYPCRKVASKTAVTLHTIIPEWIPILQKALEDSEWTPGQRRICSLHFDENKRTFLGSCKRGIQRGAVPIYYLTSSSPERPPNPTTNSDSDQHAQCNNNNSDDIIITSSYSMASKSSSATTATSSSSLPSSSSVSTFDNDNTNIQSASDSIDDDLVLDTSSSSHFNTTSTPTTTISDESVSVSSTHQHTSHQPSTSTSNNNNTKVGVSKNNNIISRIRSKYVIRYTVYEQLEQCKQLLAISESKVRNLTRTNEFYKNEIETLQNKEQDLIILCDELITKLVKYEMDQNVLKNLNVTLKILFDMEKEKQNAMDLSDIRYTSDILKFARTIHSYSEECYDFLRKDLPLPDPQTLKDLMSFDD